MGELLVFDDSSYTTGLGDLETGGLFEGKRIVKSGLKGGEKVVSTRLQLLQAGMKVTPVPEENPASETDTKKSVAESQNEK